MSAGGLRSFRHGVHPDEHKETASLATARLPFSDAFILPLSQHLGAPSRPVVSVGQPVERGQLIAEPVGFVSTAIHSPVTGRVRAIGKRRHPNGHLQDAIEIGSDRVATQRLADRSPIDLSTLTRKEFVQHVQQAGMVGLGGAAFPSHVKYNPPADKRLRWLVVNGSECEPYLTCDHRVMVERPEAVLRGAMILAEVLGIEGIKVGVEANKDEAIAALRSVAPNDGFIEVLGLRVKYPQGAEKMLVKAIFNREVPAGKLPIDLGIIVNNVGTMAAIADYFDHGQPLIERVVTVAGPGIERPANLIVPLGTPVREVMNYCGIKPETRHVVMGGPMMGQPLSSLDVPVVKGTSGLLAFTQGEGEQREEFSCVRCGRCLDACANFLNPSRLARLMRAGRYDLLEAQFVLDCMECGACAYACPSGIPIVQLVRVAKGLVRERLQREKAQQSNASRPATATDRTA